MTSSSPVVIDQKNESLFTDAKGNHPLNDSWVVWFHGMDDQNWSKDSYKKLDEFNTVEKFWGIYNNFPSIVNGMWFLMRKEDRNGGLSTSIYPLWEDPACINGGAWLFKIHKAHSDIVWLNLSLLLVGETICADSNEILGISISPKRHYVTIRIWNRDKNKNDRSLLNIPHMESDDAIYKPHGTHSDTAAIE